MRVIAAVPGSPQPQFAELPEPPAPGPGELLCRTLELGVCGTDREILLSQHPRVPPAAPFLALGHECLAEVLAVGAGDCRFRPGDLVVPVVRRPLAAAAYRYSPPRRVDLLPFGAFTERGIVCEHGFSAPRWLDRPEWLIPVPHNLTELAVFTEPLAVAEKAVNEARLLQQARLGADAWPVGPAPGAAPPKVLVTGLGPIGFAALLAARARNWPVAVAGRDSPGAFRAELVRRFGGEYLAFPVGVLALADEPGYDPEQHGFDLVLECTGAADWMLSAAAAVRSCGVCVWLGSSRVPQAQRHNVERLMRDGLLRNQLHLGSVNAAPRDFDDALAHLAALQTLYGAELRGLVTARVRPEDALPHYAGRQPQGIKTVVAFA